MALSMKSELTFHGVGEGYNMMQGFLSPVLRVFVFFVFYEGLTPHRYRISPVFTGLRIMAGVPPAGGEYNMARLHRA